MRAHIEHLIQDLRFAARQLRRNPLFALAAILTLALGIGANTAIFSVADAVLLRPLPYPNSNRLLLVWNELSKLNVHQMGLSAEDFEAFRACPVFLNTAAFQEQDRNLVTASAAERVTSIAATPRLLEMLGARLSLGQGAILSHALFVRRFAANPATIGQTIRLGDRAYVVVGVLPKDFAFSLGSGSVDVWTPLPPLAERRKAQLQMLALLHPNVSLEAAHSSIKAIAQHLNETVHPYAGPNGEDGGYTARVISLHDQLLRNFRKGTLLLMSAVALVLLIACVNVTNLLVARAAAREKEIAIRRSLGASTLRLMRQSLAEAGLLTMLGGTAGIVVSFWGVGALKAIAPGDLPGIAKIEIDGRELLFTLAVCAVTCLLFSLAPSISIAQMAEKLRGAGRRQRLSNVLIAAEAAFALTLLVGSGLLLKSFAELRKIDTGVRTDHVLTMQVELSGSRYEKPRDRVRYFSELQSRLAQLPGVISVSAAGRLPVFTAGVDTREGNPFSIDGGNFRAEAPMRQIAHTDTVGLDYFRTMGVPLLSGRAFSNADTLDSPSVAMINQTLARRFFPKKDPVGKRILFGLPGPGARWLKIIGVIGDLRTGALDLPPMPQFYTPQTQDANSRMIVLLRTAADPKLMTSATVATMRQIDPEVPAGHIGTMEEHVNETVDQPRFRTLLLSFFAAAALFLSAVGIYGVVTHAVVQRTKEIGIRMALGANAHAVAMTVLKDGLWPVGIGILIGLSGVMVLTRFLASSRYLASILYNVTPSDTATLFGAVVVLVSVSAMACIIPIRRAAGVDPTVALKYD